MAGAVDILRAIARGDRAEAGSLAEAPDGSPLAAALGRHLARPPGARVYDEADAFAAFIDNGANPELYRRTGEDERLSRLAERYEAGVAEYEAHPEVVDGFLMPVLAGQVEPGRERYTWEQSADGWARDLGEAGFTAVAVTPLLDHWWAPAVLVTGSAEPPAAATIAAGGRAGD